MAHSMNWLYQDIKLSLISTKISLIGKESDSKIILNKDNYALARDLKIPMEVIHGRLDPLVIGANLRAIAKSNKYFHLTETFGGHDIVGAKATKSNKIIKETLIHYLLHVDL